MIRLAGVYEHQPAIRRLASFCPLDPVAVDALGEAIAQRVRVRARREFVAEGAPVAGPGLIVNGWAARVRLLPDGRRQFLSFLLPGDMFGISDQPDPIAASTVMALTDVDHCRAPSARNSPSLARAYAVSRAFDEAYLLDHVTRLGRLNAYERMMSLLLELHERLRRVGLASENSFSLPLTQETLADALGLTPVHVNRTLKQARRNGDIIWQAGRATINNSALIAQQIGRRPVRVTQAARRA